MHLANMPVLDAPGCKCLIAVEAEGLLPVVKEIQVNIQVRLPREKLSTEGARMDGLNFRMLVPLVTP